MPTLTPFRKKKKPPIVEQPKTPDVDLEAWLNHEKEIPCQIGVSLPFHPPRQCCAPSEWAANPVLGCSCHHQGMVYLCQRCKDNCIDMMAAECSRCHAPVLDWSWVERVRGSK